MRPEASAGCAPATSVVSAVAWSAACPIRQLFHSRFQPGTTNHRRCHLRAGSRKAKARLVSVVCCTAAAAGAPPSHRPSAAFPAAKCIHIRQPHRGMLPLAGALAAVEAPIEPVAFATFRPSDFAEATAIGCRAKERTWAPLIPGRKETYAWRTTIYNRTLEQSYYRQYGASLFGITMAKKGWDCMRHYEILSSGTVPFFLDIDKLPPGTMFSFPKELVQQAMSLAGVPSSEASPHSTTRTTRRSPKSTTQSSTSTPTVLCVTSCLPTRNRGSRPPSCATCSRARANSQRWGDCAPGRSAHPHAHA